MGRFASRGAVVWLRLAPGATYKLAVSLVAGAIAAMVR